MRSLTRCSPIWVTPCMNDKWTKSGLALFTFLATERFVFGALIGRTVGLMPSGGVTRSKRTTRGDNGSLRALCMIGP